MLLEAGATLDEFAGAAADSVANGKTAFAYLLGVVEGRRKDAKQASGGIKHGSLKAEKPWYITASGIEAKAKELDLEKGRDELHPDFTARVLNAAGITTDDVRKATNDFRVVA